MSTRIVTFLGLGKPTPPHYEPCRYTLGEVVTPSPTPIQDTVTVMAYPAPISLLVLGTKEVRDRWFDGRQLFRTLLEQALPAQTQPPALGFQLLPDGKTDDERWQIFNEVVHALSPEPLTLQDPATGSATLEASPPQTIILDITHGFRSQPFFAASAVQFARSQLRRSRQPLLETELRILYAAFEARDGDLTPVWELTQFTEVLAWDAAIDGLLRFGRADDLRALLAGLQGRLVRLSENRPMPKLKNLGDAARNMADALVTVRMPALFTELAQRLGGAVGLSRDDVLRYIPPLAPQLDALKRWVEPMAARNPVSPQGLWAGLHLARVYLELERYAELAGLLRELLVSAYTVRGCEASAILQPDTGGTAFDRQRDELEGRLGEAVVARRFEDSLVRLFQEVGDLRNDVLHAGCRSNARSAATIRQDLERLLKEVEAELQQLTAFGDKGPNR
jgi:CRISPR-associated protein Csx16